MDGPEVDSWFADYLNAFGAVVRGEREVVELLQWYAVPLTITLDDAVVQMATADELVAVVGNQVRQLQAGGFSRSVESFGSTTLVNPFTALRREKLARRRTDDSVIDEVEMTYVIVSANVGGPRITLMAVHS